MTRTVQDPEPHPATLGLLEGVRRRPRVRVVRQDEQHVPVVVTRVVPTDNQERSPSERGYDYDHLRRWLRGRGIRHRIARKGIESSTRLGRHRWTIERTMSWLAGCRRLHRRYERKADHFLAFTSIACTLICYRRLTK